MSITSSENKELLLQLLDNHPVKKQNSSEFMVLFDQQLERIHKERYSYKNNLTEMNKELLRAFQSISIEPETFVLNPKPSQARGYPEKPFNKPPKIKIFEERLKLQQENFNDMNNPKKPPEIDFSDKGVEEDMTNTDMDSAMQQRENELKKIMEQIPEKSKEAEEWIKKGGKSQNKKVTFDDSHITHSNSIANVGPVLKPSIKPSIKPSVEGDITTSNLYDKLKIKNTTSSPSIGTQNINTQLLKDSLAIQNNILTKLEEIVSYLKDKKKD
jgi:hypothetical protein